MRQWPNVMLGGRTLKAFRWSAIDAAERKDSSAAGTN
jgi:hypothetical protein